ncbi:hypothetical protein TELCIR_09560, partial [Teladorsagia circumcincta]
YPNCGIERNTPAAEDSSERISLLDRDGDLSVPHHFALDQRLVLHYGHSVIDLLDGKNLEHESHALQHETSSLLPPVLDAGSYDWKEAVCNTYMPWSYQQYYGITKRMCKIRFAMLLNEILAWTATKYSSRYVANGKVQQKLYDATEKKT